MEREMEPTTEPFGEAVKRLLPYAGGWVDKAGRLQAMSERQLARTMGLSPRSANSMISGEWTPDIERIERAATALGVSPSHFAEYRLECVRRKLDWRSDDKRLSTRRRRLREALNWYRRLVITDALRQSESGEGEVAAEVEAGLEDDLGATGETAP